MHFMGRDVLKWLVLKEKIENLQQQQKWTGDSLAGLRRCQQDYGTTPKAEFERVTAQAVKHLREMSRESVELRIQKEAIEKKVGLE